MKRVRIVKMCEIAFLVYTIATFIVIMIVKWRDGIAYFSWNVESSVLTAVLCISLHRLRQLQRELKSGVYVCDKKLVVMHQTAFILAAVLGLISYGFSGLATIYEDNAAFKICQQLFAYLQLPSWSSV